MVSISNLQIKFLLFWQENFISGETFLERLFIFSKEKITEVRGKFLRYYNLFLFIMDKKLYHICI